MKKILFIIITLFLFNSKVFSLEIDSKNVILYNLNENKAIYEKNSDEVISIASLTKIMTTIVAIENIDNLDEKVIIKTRDFVTLYEEGASLAGFEVGQEVTYRDLLYGTFLPSGAEATQALAFNISGSIEDFVKLMNEKANELGLKNTEFANTTGLDNKNNYSTVEDISILLKYALENEIFKEIYEAKSYVTSDNELTFYSTLRYTAMKYNYDINYIIGGKTGYTDDAGKCLASTAYDEKNDIKYMLVTCRATIDYYNPYHIIDAYNIYNYYFENYKYQTIVDKDELLVSIKTKYGIDDYALFYLKEPILYYLKNDYDINKVSIKYDGINEIDNKIKKYETIGKASIYYDNELITTIDIVLNDEYKFSIMNYLIETKLLYFSIVLIILIILLPLIFHKKRNSK